ncbi:MAG: hypothetical protein AAGI37_15590 [Planctomycetota bacterium]
MLKFLRKYQKWMLVIFCGALMVAFLIPQAVSQFAPNPAKTVVATTYDGEPIIRSEIQRVSADVQLLQRLRIEPPELAGFGLSLIPRTGSERDDALAWIMIQRAAERNGLGASQQEAFNLIASVLGLQDFDSLDERAKDFNANGNYLVELGRQYLMAEQYRQLVSGTEFTLPEDEDGVGSPGIRRVVAMNQAMQAIGQSIQQSAQQFSMFGQQVDAGTMRQIEAFAVQQVMRDQGFLDKIQGHERYTATELRYALQQQFSEIDLTVVVLNAKDQLDTTIVDDAYIQGIFERFADDVPGTGVPYGLGYREPDKVQLEALRIPIDAVRDAVAKTITPEDVRTFYNENVERGAFVDDTPPAEGELPSSEPMKLTPDLRDQIRQTLTIIRAQEKVVEIAQKARQRLNEDARGLPDDGAYKKLPDDFVPTPLSDVVAEIKEEHGITPEIINVDEFVSAEDLVTTTRFTSSWISTLPRSTVKTPNPNGFGPMVDTELFETVLGGKAGLFTAFVPDLSSARQNQVFRLADYIFFAQPFRTEAQREQVDLPLQVGLPGMFLSDFSRSTYVFRITKAQPSRPAPELAPLLEQVKEEATLVKAYEDLAEEQAVLLKRAADQTIERLMPDADAKNTLTGLTRDSINNRFSAMIDGVSSSRPILERAFGVADDLISAGGLDRASESDRLFAVELPGDYKLAVVRLDSFRAMTRERYEQEAIKPASQMLVTRLGMTELPEPPLSFEALQRYTGFKWAEGFGPEEDDEDSEGSGSEESE